MDLHRYRRRLPHWRIDGASYFLTWNLQVEQPVLRDGERDVVLQTLLHFDRVRYELHAAVVMDDHVHVLVTSYAAYTVGAILHTWKSFTANRLQRQSNSRRGAIWQSETFDHIVRNEASFVRFARYIANNPRERWPTCVDYRWLVCAVFPLRGDASTTESV